VGSLNFMRLSLMKGAHAVLSRSAYRKFGAARSFFARCGIPQASPSSLLRTRQLRPGAPCSHQRTWAENDGRSPPQPYAPNSTVLSFRPQRSLMAGLRFSSQGISPPQFPHPSITRRLRLDPPAEKNSQSPATRKPAESLSPWHYEEQKKEFLSP
jgi:hypothetical protein